MMVSLTSQPKVFHEFQAVISVREYGGGGKGEYGRGERRVD
jgi:hypothetical protein